VIYCHFENVLRQKYLIDSEYTPTVARFPYCACKNVTLPGFYIQYSNLITDNHNRAINYLRLAVTDRCNLRCFYCMPESGLDWLQRSELMSNAEMLRISHLLVKMGITKIRITGGEPFVRKDIMELLNNLAHLDGLEQIAITTNGILTAPLVPELLKIGIRSFNLSLDALDAARFFSITKRDSLREVLHTLDTLLCHGAEVRINAVVMADKNIDDILPLVALTKDLPVSVRFIEEMPFNGVSHKYEGLTWDYIRIVEYIKNTYPMLSKLPDPPYSTSYNYRIQGHRGTVGVIAAYTRSFCGTCNRIRITPQGMLKTCLYDNGVLNIRDAVRNGLDDNAIASLLLGSIRARYKDGWEAEAAAPKDDSRESMATIGG
jgi:molybdenum cofactor biosynthesis protein A